MFAIGFDVGGTKIEAALIGFSDEDTHLNATTNNQNLSFEFETRKGAMLRGEVLARKRVPTERQLGYEQIVVKMAALVGEVCRHGGVQMGDLFGIGFAIPGSVCPKTLRMLNGNTLVLKDRDLASDLLKRLGQESIPVRAENDANCFALGEALCGAGLIHARKIGLTARSLCSVGLILGTGCGGGIVVNGDTIRGRRGGAAEVGHIIIKDNGLPCYCGQRGCAEQYLSGSGLEQAFNGRRYSQVQDFQSAKAIFALAAGWDPIALSVVKAFKQDLAQFMAQLTALIDPDFFVLGGGVSLQEILYEGLSEDAGRRSFLPDTLVPVYRHALGDSAGVIGAALLVMKDS